MIRPHIEIVEHVLSFKAQLSICCSPSRHVGIAWHVMGGGSFLSSTAHVPERSKPFPSRLQRRPALQLMPANPPHIPPASPGRAVLLPQVPEASGKFPERAHVKPAL